MKFFIAKTLFSYSDLRYMKILKIYVWNHNRPEGCIIKCYVIEEALEFCAEYMSNMCTIGLPLGHKQNLSIDKPLSSGKQVQVNPNSLDQAYLYILHNIREVEPHIR